MYILLSVKNSNYWREEKLKVKVKYLSTLRNYTNTFSEILELPRNNITISELVEIITKKYPKTKEMLLDATILLNKSLAKKEDKVMEGSEIIILPPASEG